MVFSEPPDSKTFRLLRWSVEVLFNVISRLGYEKNPLWHYHETIKDICLALYKSNERLCEQQELQLMPVYIIDSKNGVEKEVKASVVMLAGRAFVPINIIAKNIIFSNMADIKLDDAKDVGDYEALVFGDYTEPLDDVYLFGYMKPMMCKRAVIDSPGLRITVEPLGGIERFLCMYNGFRSSFISLAPVKYTVQADTRRGIIIYKNMKFYRDYDKENERYNFYLKLYNAEAIGNVKPIDVSVAALYHGHEIPRLAKRYLLKHVDAKPGTFTHRLLIYSISDEAENWFRVYPPIKEAIIAFNKLAQLLDED